MQAPGISTARFPGSSAFIATGPGGVWARI